MKATRLVFTTAGIGLALACSNPVAPVASISGSWIGGSPIQIVVTLNQTRDRFSASGQIGKIGVSDFFVDRVNGDGTIAPDSTLRVDLDGLAGHQVLQARLLPTGVISGIISGDRIEGDGVQTITLSRYVPIP